ncbi:MAG: protein kinase [Acidobacteriota bacterium]
MDQPHDDRITELVHACAHMSAEERDEFLTTECDGYPDLRREVEEAVEKGPPANTFADAADLQRGLPDHYRLIKLIGTGGMSEVFLAEDTRLGRRVAIKFLNETFKRDRERMKRFNLEARSTSALNHPNILTIYDIGDVGGVQYIVSEYVDGETLGARAGRSQFTIGDLVKASIQIASALGAAHKAGVVHRDLKPENIMFRSDGSVKVVDFGLAKASGNVISGSGGDMESLRTSPGMIVGTPGFMSPEQTRGLPLDGRSDIFSLGILMFKMLTGHSPFGGDNVIDLITAIISKEPRPATDYVTDPPAQLVRIIDKTLQKDPDDRYASMEDLLVDLEDLRADMVWSVDHLRRSGSMEPTRITREFTQQLPMPRRNYFLIGGGALVVVAAIGLMLYLVRSGSGGVPPTPMRTVPITSWSSVSTESMASSSFSPDSRIIAFASKKSGSTEIWVKPVVGGDPIQVTKSGFENQYPVWSPDGQEIAFFSIRDRNFGIWRASFIGGSETQIVNGVSARARPLYWSADHKLFFQDGENPELFSVDISSGERKQLTDLGSTGIRARTIAISNDGAAFAISVRENDTWKVKTKRFDEQAFTEIASQKEPVDSVVFHPNGKSIFFAAALDGIMQIFEAKAGQAEPVRISNGTNDFFLQDVSEDGSKVLYNSVTETSDVWMVNLADGKESVVANDVPEEYWADFSPDGRSVAYQSVTRPDKPFRGSIFVKPQLTSGTPVAVSPDGFAPVWSNDGQWIAFFRQNDAGMSLWKVRSNGADVVKLADGGTLGYLSTPYLKIGINQISWSPDGGNIAYSTKTDGISNIWLVAADGTGNRVLTTNTDPKDTYCCSTWTHDGSQLAFASEIQSSPKSFSIWLAGADGQNAKVIFESKDQFRYLGFTPNSGEIVIAQKADTHDISQTPALTYIYAVSVTTGAARKVNTLTNIYFHNIYVSRDGQTLAFVSRSNDTNELWTVPALGGTPKKVLFENDPKVMFSSLAWSPDGRSIIFGKQTRTNLLSMLTN